ncbi:hypothetical protein CONLIGDRAFT_649000 [Coniochaeta ligniaria NRRL 30616]|uniref:Uncharacterized protein n=1 Tax=Coniochaeta ligniaria NRRL 30616 TaxID=1408157 RepID=A0A1J7J9M6_9PEZI|nr:hypothetical protein CONLIGDRAFT_649000 [Coniochaeta ligniaria NRRL 30616]
MRHTDEGLDDEEVAVTEAQESSTAANPETAVVPEGHLKPEPSPEAADEEPVKDAEPAVDAETTVVKAKENARPEAVNGERTIKSGGEGGGKGGGPQASRRSGMLSFCTARTSSPLLFYFDHGSAAQYLHSLTIRGLNPPLPLRVPMAAPPQPAVPH